MTRSRGPAWLRHRTTSQDEPRREARPCSASRPRSAGSIASTVSFEPLGAEAKALWPSMQARRGSVGSPDQHALDRWIAGEEAGAIGGRRVERRVAHRQLERLQLLDDLVERRPARTRPLHFRPADELVIAGEMRGKVGDVTADIGVKPLFRLGIDRKSTRLIKSLMRISYAVFCLKKKKKHQSNR